mgnify:CR=1 FL=1
MQWRLPAGATQSRALEVRDEAAIVAKFGVPPASIPDYLALVGDSADGYPGLPGWGAKSAAAVLARFGHLENIPEDPRAWNVNASRPGALAQRRNYRLGLEAVEHVVVERGKIGQQLSEGRTDIARQREYLVVPEPCIEPNNPRRRGNDEDRGKRQAFPTLHGIAFAMCASIRPGRRGLT